MASVCITAGTQIVVGAVFDENDVFVQYVTKNIEDIKVGDFVYSYDTITGEVSLREVTATFVREVDHINYLTILDEFGNEQVIATTDSHPFWVVTDEPDLERAARGTVDENGVILYHENIDPGLNGFWVEAKDLREGDVFLGANGELLTLVSQERVEFGESITVYNFTVDGNHNYFVIAAEDEYGQTCVLVHNAHEQYDPVQEHQDRMRQAKDNIRGTTSLFAQIADTVAGIFNPIVNFLEAALGETASGQKLSATERALAAAAVVPGVKVGEKLFEVARVAAKKGDDIAAVATRLTDTIARHALDRNHFRKKSFAELKVLVNTTIENGVKYTSKDDIPGRVMFYDKSTGIAVIFDGKGGGSMYRPDNLSKFLADWKIVL